ncbi:type II toxin-antitoxin system mRNA interferase toxin, RelE/StbE family [Candidatus Micrarchaeota archaeon]|nr:type II toxin-antitoxin system mRNA interferase toxin, RelE/StbE family [Candidatus Micrarchaeota archaeon]
MSYSIDYDGHFLRRLSKLKKQDPPLYERLEKKMEEIVENPEHYKPLQNVLKGKRRAHVGHFVIVFSFSENVITFLEFDHHDNVY